MQQTAPAAWARRLGGGPAAACRRRQVGADGGAWRVRQQAEGVHHLACVQRSQSLREGLPLAGFDRRTLYTAGPAGYTDYPLAD